MEYNVFLESYVYHRTQGSRVLLVNLLEDTAFTVSDGLLAALVNRISSSENNMAKMCEPEFSRFYPVIEKLRKKYLADFTGYDVSTYQFTPEVNVLEGLDAQQKVSAYSQTGILNYVSEAFVFLNNEADCIETLTYLLNNEEDANAMHGKYCLNSLDVESVIGTALTLAGCPGIKRIALIGMNGSDIRLIEKEERLTQLMLDKKLIFYITSSHLQNDASIIRYIRENKCECVILADDKNFNTEILSVIGDCALLAYPVRDASGLEENNKINGTVKGIRTKPYIVLTESNKEEMSRRLRFSLKELTGRGHFYKTIRCNNCLNSKLWGKIYIVGGRYLSFGTDNVVDFYGKNVMSELQGRISSLSCDWFRIRDYRECSDCELRHICPSPTSMEDFLRRKGTLQCLVYDRLP